MKSIVSTLHLIRSAASTFLPSRSGVTSNVGHVARKSSVALLALLAVGAMFSTASTATAAIVRIYASVAGYGEVRVLPGSNTGGRVVWHQNGYFYTDRVARGELLSIQAAPEAEFGETMGDVAWVGHKKADTGSAHFFFKDGLLPLRHTLRIPQDSTFSNMEAFSLVLKNGNVTTLRIPIGSR